jgi:HEPN domain-containing protein
MAKTNEPRAEAYRDAAAERCADAAALLDAGRFACAIWVAGVAMECLFRAYHRRSSDRLDTGHDLKQLFRESGFSDHVAPRHVVRMANSISEVAKHWKHRYRYDPSAAVQRSVRARTSAEFRRRAQRIVNEAQEVVAHGVSRWQSRH